MDDEIVPEDFGHQILGDVCLGILGEVVLYYQDMLFISLPWLQAQVIIVH